MKNAIKMYLPEVRVNPINRDLLLVVTIAMVVAVTFITAGMMVISQL
jgi:hypothetical protein